MKTDSRLGFSTLILRITSPLSAAKRPGSTSSADETLRIHALPWLRTSDTPGTARSRSSDTSSLVSSSMKSARTRDLSSLGVPVATNFPWSMMATRSQRLSASSM